MTLMLVVRWPVPPLPRRPAILGSRGRGGGGALCRERGLDGGPGTGFVQVEVSHLLLLQVGDQLDLLHLHLLHLLPAPIWCR